MCALGRGASWCLDEPARERLTADADRARGGSSLLASRCAGPLDTDLAGAIPVPSLPLASALKGHRSVDLSGVHDFGRGGFAGTVRSTLVLHLLGAQTGGPTRIVVEPLSLVRSTGALTLEIQGAANPDACAVLDSCGAHGTMTLTPRPVSPQGALEAIGSARRPYRDFVAALGLSRRGRPAGIAVTGSVSWARGGTIASSLMQSSQCSWTGPLGLGAVLLSVSRGVLSGRYLDLGPLERRCPGPEIGSNTVALGSGAAPLRDLLTGGLTLWLHHGRFL